MKLDASAKLNLRLRVLGRRADGFHAIETLLVRLRLADAVELETDGDGIELRVETPAVFGPVPDDESNLCWRAARMLYEAIDRPPAVRIRLTKRIPAAAGLGGGSSDAAAVLVGLNRRLGEPLEPAALLRLAGRLGSDVPFFAAEAAFALAWDRGERVLPLAPPPARPVLIVVPDIGIRAAEAYGWWSEDAAAGEAAPEILPGADRLASWATLERLAVNDLAGPVERRRPELAAARRALASAGATVALLCGSGSCVAGVYREEAERDAARTALTADPDIDTAWQLISTSTEGPAEP